MFSFSLFKKKETNKEENRTKNINEIKEEKEVKEEKEENVEIIEEEIENAFENQLSVIDKFEVNNNHRFITKMRLKYILWAIEHNIILYNDDNRLINEERINNFNDFNVFESDPIILGKYYDYHQELYVYDIIDGQHRLEYLKKNELKYNDIDILLDIRVYKSKDDFYKILDIINNRLNFDHKQLRQFKYNEFKNYIETYYKKKIKKSIFGIQRPYVNEEKFKQKLFQTKFFNNIENKDIDIFEKFININQFLSKIIVNENKIKNDLKNKFDKLECYISIDKDYIGIELFDIHQEKYVEYWNSKNKKFN